jgi:uncharacterized RmlC-like cupin family protein|tara:strand:+ start:223 stop:447 length:225 start_codon:yes stop_codon:yes gene_type:complete
MRWGDALEFVAEAEAGDFIFAPPLSRIRKSTRTPMNPSTASWFVAARTPMVVNLDIAPVEPPEEIRWIGPKHPA